MSNKIYTSYFGNAKNLNSRKYALIGIAGRSPKGWTGLEYKKLAPSWDIWKTWHDQIEEGKNNQEYFKTIKKGANIAYTLRFNKQILGNLNAVEVVNDIFKLADGKIPVLLCYEKPGDFCHRHLVADWLNSNIHDVTVVEWDNFVENPVLF